MNIFFLYLVRAQILSEVNHFCLQNRCLCLRMQKRTRFGGKELDNFQERCRTNPLAPKSHFPISSTYPPTVIPYTPKCHPSTRERLQECTRDRRAVFLGVWGGVRLPLICIPSPTQLSTAHINPPPHPSYNHRSEISMPIVRLRRAPLLYLLTMWSTQLLT